MSEDGLRKFHRNCGCLQGLLRCCRRNREMSIVTGDEDEVDAQGLIDNGSNATGKSLFNSFRYKFV